MAYTTTTCPHCGYKMAPDHDYINKVKVLVCTKPTFLYRVYPGYPRRNGDVSPGNSKPDTDAHP